MNGNTTEMERRIRSLPKWAQMHIGQLENLVDRWKERAMAPEDQAEENSPVRIQYGYDETKALPVHSRIRFDLPNGEYVEASLEEDRVLVRGSAVIVLNPRVANTIHVRSGRDLY